MRGAQRGFVRYFACVPCGELFLPPGTLAFLCECDGLEEGLAAHQLPAGRACPGCIGRQHPISLGRIARPHAVGPYRGESRAAPEEALLFLCGACASLSLTASLLEELILALPPGQPARTSASALALRVRVLALLGRR